MQHPIIKQIEQEQMQGKKMPAFAAGDTVIVKVKIKEGDRERLQSYEGVVIAKKNRGLNSSFTVRKISHDEGVERVFQTYSPQIESVSVKRKGEVRKAKLYHLRNLSGRKARIREKIVAKNKNVAELAVASKPEEKNIASDSPEDSSANS